MYECFCVAVGWRLSIFAIWDTCAGIVTAEWERAAHKHPRVLP